MPICCRHVCMRARNRLAIAHKNLLSQAFHKKNITVLLVYYYYRFLFLVTLCISSQQFEVFVLLLKALYKYRFEFHSCIGKLMHIKTNKSKAFF